MTWHLPKTSNGKLGTEDSLLLCFLSLLSLFPETGVWVYRVRDMTCVLYLFASYSITLNWRAPVTCGRGIFPTLQE